MITLSSCEDPQEPIPSYLYIEPFTLRTDEAAQGSASANITEVWLSVDGQFLGAYSLPATVPVLAEGRLELNLQAGIRDNGISTTPEIYPYYNIYLAEGDLAPNAIDTVRPSITYSERTRFAFIDDYERSAPLFRDLRVGTIDNQIQVVEDGAFEGRASGRIRLDTQSPAVELATVSRYRDLTANSPYVYLEVNYRSDVPVVFGVIGYRDGVTGDIPRFDPGFRPRDTWNKIYFNLSPLLADHAFDEVQIALLASLPQENGNYTRSEAYIWLDNVKLLHF